MPPAAAFPRLCSGVMATPIDWKPFAGFLPEDLWPSTAPRSQEVTPVLIQRYHGPHTRHPTGGSQHDDWELITAFHGRGQLHIHDLPPQPLAWPRVYLVPPHRAHQEVADTPVDTLWIGLRGRALASLDPDTPRIVRDATALQPLLEQLWLTSLRRTHGCGMELDGLVHAILGRCLRLSQEERAHHFVQQAAMYLREKATDPTLTVAGVAEKFGYSEGYFHRAFRRAEGVAPGQYLTRVRVELAVGLLQQSALPVGRIARLSGFADPLYFSRVVRKVTGRSPQQWRV